MYYHSAIADRNSNPRELWKFIKTVIPSKSSTSSNPAELNVDDRTVENADEIALTFNNHFVEIGRSIAQSIRHSSEVNFKMFLKKTVSQTIVLDPPQPKEIFNVISSLNPHKATGYDISSYFLRIGNKILAPVLSLFFECVFELGVFPQIFKTTKVIPIHKSDNKKLVSNYRPISLLPSLSKVLEKVIKHRLVNFFNKHNVLYDYQCGFRKKHSVINALLDVTTLTYDAMQKNSYTALLLMDIRKAFDTVSHHILLHKLYLYGVRGPAHSLIESYLTSRKQFVSISNQQSCTKSINIGVPQGSILGPLLFLIYINDLSNAVSSCPPSLC